MAVYKKDGKWYFKGKYKLEDGTWKNYNRVGGKTKKEALEVEKKFLSRKDEEVKYAGSMTFSELKELYFEKAKRRNKISTIISGQVGLKNFSQLDNLKIELIRKNTVEKLIYEMDKKSYSAKYIQRNITSLKSIFNFAVKEKLLTSNPLNGLESFKRPNEIKKEMKCWTYDEFIKFSNSFNNDTKLYKYKVFLDFLYFMGTRRGEALALTWKDIDFEKNTVKINKNMSFSGKGIGFLSSSPKNDNSYRTIQMPKILREEMKGFYEYSKQMYHFTDDFFVFYGIKPLCPGSIRYQFNKHIELSCVRKIRIHDLRHSHASFLINNGANDKAIADRLGNTVTMVREVYSHLFQETEDQLINIIDENTY